MRLEQQLGSKGFDLKLKCCEPRFSQQCCTRCAKIQGLHLAGYSRGKFCVLVHAPSPLFAAIAQETCGERVLQRFGHRTLPPEDKSLEASSL